MRNWLNKKRKNWTSADPIMIQPYRGFANKEKVFLKGRVLENEGLRKAKGQSFISNLVDSLKRFESDEIDGAKLRIDVEGYTFDLISDHEGYFTLEDEWGFNGSLESPKWIKASLELLEVPNRIDLPPESTAEIFVPADNSDFGIISDVDDTVLQSFVTSRMRARMYYHTLFKNAHQRKPMEGVVELFHAFEKGKSGLGQNPFFYVSHSPWNIFDLLKDFMVFNHLPKGPILLRDYGRSKSRSGAFHDHKIKSLRRIIGMYPKMRFILLGDTAADDADFYIQMWNEFPEQIAAIYIRLTKFNQNARRVKLLMETCGVPNAVLVNSSSEIMEHARVAGFIQ